MVCVTEKPNFLDASCCKVEVVNGAAGDFFAGFGFGDQRGDPAFLPAAIDDRAFDGLDGDRLVVDVEGARGLARRGADAAGKFGEIIGG